MVTKKTSSEDVKKVSAPVIADVKKPTAKKTKAVAEKAVEAKVDTVVKTPSKNTANKKTAKSADKPVDVVASVLEIKAKNEAKKASKPAKSMAVEAVEKGAKAVSAKSKRDAVKENAQKAEARKFMELKEEASTQNNSSRPCGYRKNGLKEILIAWVDGYRNIFNYKSRTSRFDFWSFMLVNFFVTLFVVAPYDWALFNAQANKTTIAAPMIYAYWLFTFFEALVYLPLFIRRLHDINYSGWKGYFRQLTFLVIGLLVLMILGTKTILTDNVSNVTTLWAVAFLAALFFTAYYLLKIFITAGFIEGDYEDNAYGEPTIADRFCKRRILRMASTYILLASTYLIITFCIQMSFEMRDYCYTLLFN